jgi:hypothetical protein
MYIVQYSRVSKSHHSHANPDSDPLFDADPDPDPDPDHVFHSNTDPDQLPNVMQIQIRNPAMKQILVDQVNVQKTDVPTQFVIIYICSEHAFILSG